MSPDAAIAAKPSILLIDDDPISREVHSMLLELAGYRVATAQDGAEALARLQASRPQDLTPDLILMDAQLPGLSGLELVDALRQALRDRGSKASQSLHPIRIVAISGSPVADALRMACDGFLLKPIDPAQVEFLLHDAPEQLPARIGLGDTQDASEAAIDAVIDPKVLAKLQAMMAPAAVRQIFEAVAADLEVRLASLAQAIEAGDTAEVVRIAHIVKGGCAIAGLTAAVAAASLLESDNRNGTWRKELSRLRATLHAVQGILSTEFPA